MTEDQTPLEADRKWYGYAVFVAFVAGLGFFALSFLLLGIIPGRSLDKLVAEQAPAAMLDYTPAQARGRQIYGAEGCAYCHTQQVRFVPADVVRWGAPTEAWETKYDAPQLWGTRRIGPDLAREAGVRPDDWQLTHLFDPRSTVRDSVMPGYPWLFDGAAAAPRQEALDLVAYLQTLGRERTNSGYDTNGHSEDPDVVLGSSKAEADHEAMRGLQPRPDANSVAAIIDGIPGSVLLASGGNRAQGAELFAANCASCHGAKLDGVSEAAKSLLPKPKNLRASIYTPERVAQVLWNGVAGTSMPAWRDMPLTDLKDLTAYVSTLTPQPGASDTVDLALAAKGAPIFAANCTGCHGANGAGDGPAAASMTPRPTNFHLQQPSADRIMDVLAKGVPGTSMPSWESVLSEDDRRVLASYVRSLQTETEEGSR